MPQQLERWEIIRPLGSGAQGMVHLVRNLDRVSARDECLRKIRNSITRMTSTYRPNEEQWPELAHQLSEAIIDYSRPESPAELGALKRFDIREGGPTAERVIQRFRCEVDVLGKLQQPGILRLLDANVDERWMVTEYHPGGTLAEHPERYKGKVLVALEAFRALVASLATLHAANTVHRDIKPVNIFVAADGRLVLGDFGIVYFEDQRRERLTDTFERVGARDWMAPWANTGMRIEDVKPSFDVFPLGKVLWSMISGVPVLPFWYHNRDHCNLEKLFPDDPDMAVINSILNHCIVEDEATCLPSAAELLQRVDDSLRILRLGGQILEGREPTRCRICGKGQYHRETDSSSLSFAGRPVSLVAYVCDSCGHLMAFKANHA